MSDVWRALVRHIQAQNFWCWEAGSESRLSGQTGQKREMGFPGSAWQTYTRRNRHQAVLVVRGCCLHGARPSSWAFPVWPALSKTAEYNTAHAESLRIRSRNSLSARPDSRSLFWTEPSTEDRLQQYHGVVSAIVSTHPESVCGTHGDTAVSQWVWQRCCIMAVPLMLFVASDEQ